VCTFYTPTVILLIGSGWSFLKPFLTDREKKMILGVLILQVVNNLAITVLAGETEGEISFDRWTAVLHLVDIFCCCAVLMPIVWQVNQLEKNMEQNQHKGKSDEQEGQFDDHISETELEDVPMDEDESGEEVIPDARMAAKLKLFRSFYIIVMVYIYMTRIVVYLFVGTLNYKHTWMKDFFDEFSALLFYSAVGYMFRPMYENPYTHIDNRKPETAAESQVEMRVIDPSTKTALD
jgi:NADH:ubiquinone oxidoreductase subunit 3 (subunit A)